MSAACACGLTHADPSALPLIGYQRVVPGELVEMRRCTCNSTMGVAVYRDASLCARCDGLITGVDGDTKSVTGEAIYCRKCIGTIPADDMTESWRSAAEIFRQGGHIRPPMLHDGNIGSMP